MRNGILMILATLCFVGGIGLGLYIAIWWGIIDPLMTVADAYDTGDITAKLVAWELCKFLLKEIVASILVWFSWLLGLWCLKELN